MSSLPVLARGEDWIVVDKPSGLACHRSRMVRESDTVASRLYLELRTGIHLVHRLDRGASGCLIVALSPQTTRQLQEGLRHARKEYLALVRGFFRWDDPVHVDKPMKNRRGGVTEAQTTVQVLARSHDPRCSLVRAMPSTGRYHQVRRHLRDIDHPILGDGDHGDHGENKRWRKRGLRRLALHCHRIVIADAGLDATSPLPDSLTQVLRELPWWEEVAELASPSAE